MTGTQIVSFVPRIRRAKPRTPSLAYLIWLRLRLKLTMWRYFAGRNLEAAWCLLCLAVLFAKWQFWRGLCALLNWILPPRRQS